MKKLWLAIALLMFLMGFAYGQRLGRQCDTTEAICSFEVYNCVARAGTCPTGQCGNPDEAGCCLYENGYCNITGTLVTTIVCGNSCNP